MRYNSTGYRADSWKAYFANTRALRFIRFTIRVTRYITSR